MRIGLLAAIVIGAILLSIGYTKIFNSTTPESTTVASAAPVDAELDKANAVLTAMPDSPMAYLSRAVLYSRRARETADHNYNKLATTDVDKALELEPTNFVARKLKLGLLGSNHEFDIAEVEAKKLITEEPRDPFAYGILVDASIAMGKYDQAISSAQKMVDLRPDTSSYSRVALLRSLHGDHKGAVEMYEIAARIADPADKEVQAWSKTQLAAEYFKAGNLAMASKTVDQALAIFPEYPNALIAKARYLGVQGELAAAEELLTPLNSRIKLSEALILTGDISRRKGDSAMAMSYYEQAEKIEREQDGDIHRFALLWSDNNVKLAEALEVAEEDYVVNKDIYASDILAWCLLKNGKVQEAQKHIKDALRLKTNDARILFHAAVIEKTLGNSAAARKYLAAALKANPNFDVVKGPMARELAAELKLAV
ncbi:MAG: tetratricopeptide repeat protein [Blastocatellia bacterium]|nr:tetratricopeptide repeat protein [Blastocatellia bacterium]